MFAVLLLSVLLGPLLATRLRLPGMVGLIVVGMLVGPNVAGIVSGEVLIGALGFVGLLYLMFQGGLELDLDGFAARRRESIVFGVATFVLPLVAIGWVSLRFDLSLLAAAIMASALTSHTPLSYPIISRFDLARNPAVTASLGATLIANVAALLVLAVAAAAAGEGTSAIQWVVFGAGLVGFVALMLVAVPRVTRWFFQGWGQDRDVRLTYVLSGMGLAAVLGALLGIEAIVGAFLAGLAFNRFVPDGTLIAERIEVLGRLLFVPAFLISTGMMLDPLALVTDLRTIVLGLALTAAMVVSKFVASELSGRFMGYGAPERGVMFSLSVGQAAGALAAVVVGEELGLLGTAEVNAVILVIMLSALLAGVTAERAAPKAEPPGTAGRPLGRRVVVPVSNPHTVASLVRVAGQVAAPDAGAVVALNVLPFDAQPEQVRVHRRLTAQAEQAALATGAEVNTAVRIDASIDGGVLHSVVEQEGTCLVMGWEGTSGRRESLFGSVIDRCVANSPVPVLVCRPGVDEPTGRLLLVLTAEDLAPASRRGLQLLADVAGRLVRQSEADVVVLTDLDEVTLRRRLGDRLAVGEVISEPAVLRTLADEVGPGDVVLAVAPRTASRLGRGARRVAEAARDRTVVVAVPR